MKEKSILIMFHCSQYTGYAIEALEDVFLKAALKAGYRNESIHWSYNHIIDSSPRTYKISYNNYNDAIKLVELINKHNIKTILSFDMPYPTKAVIAARSAGVSNIIAYWGASMSTINSIPKLWLKKAEWLLNRNKAPDLFIFESEAMRKTATLGRGVPYKNTTIVRLGVDTNKYKPAEDKYYAHRLFDIPKQRKIIFYSGHMEERKGVKIIIEAAINIFQQNKNEDIHFLICGNKGNQAAPFLNRIGNTPAKDNITFGGYRKDIPLILQSSHIGVIASTGWDSFTMSSIEMLASGIPLIVSKLQGLSETIEPGVCGEYIEPGNHIELKEKILSICYNNALYNRYSKSARRRAIKNFSKVNQISKISKFL